MKSSSYYLGKYLEAVQNIKAGINISTNKLIAKTYKDLYKISIEL